MTTISRSALVMYTPKQMYDLVNNVAAYPLFLPWCNRVDIIAKMLMHKRHRSAFPKPL